MKDYIHWIDILKGLGIFLVILGHTIKNNDLYLWIYSFHMPLFFFISGYLMNPQTKLVCYKSFVWKKAKSLLLPFVFFRIFLVIYWFFIEKYFRQLDLGPIWFLVVLFGVEILITPLLLHWKKVWHNIIVVLLCIGLFYVFNTIQIDSRIIHELLKWLARIFNSGIWFSLAFIIKKLVCKYSFSQKFVLIIFVISMVISISGFKYNGNVSIFSNTVNNLILYLILGMSGIGMLTFICKLIIRRNSLIEWVGMYTIIILAVHEPIKRIILKCFSIICNENIEDIQSNLLLAFLISFLVLLSCVPIIMLFKWLKNHSGTMGTLMLSFVR